MATQGTHADLVARLREVYPRARKPCAWCNRSKGHQYDCPAPDVHALIDALTALPPPADPPHDCEAWRLEGLGCARCNKADPPALVALVRQWQQDVENLGGAGPDEDITDQYQKQVWESEAKLLAYPLPAAPPNGETR